MKPGGAALSQEIVHTVALPRTGLFGAWPRNDNVVQSSANMPWYRAPPSCTVGNVPVGAAIDLAHFRMAVQRGNRPDASFRGYSGTVARGVVRPGDAVLALPSRRTSSVTRIVTMDGILDEAPRRWP